MTEIAPRAIKLTFGYKVTWGIAALGTSLIAGVFGALLPIFYQDYLGLSARWIAIASAVYAHLECPERPHLWLYFRQHPLQARTPHPLHALHRTFPRRHLHPGLAGASTCR